MRDALEFAMRTDPGLVRTNNEDSVVVEPDVGVAVLADGMGGANAGEVASGMATSLLAAQLKQALGGRSRRRLVGAEGSAEALDLLRETIAAANASIFAAAESRAEQAGMGTTLVVALFFDSRLAVAHVGDSRLYRVRSGQLTQLTRDHSLVQLQIDSGVITREQARRARNRNIVTRALGIGAEVEPEFGEHAVEPGDIYVLCSDGLHDMVDEADLIAVLAQRDLPAAADHLVKLANDNGGRDNVSVILVRVHREPVAPTPWWRRWLGPLAR